MPQAIQTTRTIKPKPLACRADFDLQSDRRGELAPGTRVAVLASKSMVDGGLRVRLSLDGDKPHGRVTATSKSGQHNVAYATFEVCAA